jgi:hypothetical protein
MRSAPRPGSHSGLIDGRPRRGAADPGRHSRPLAKLEELDASSTRAVEARDSSRPQRVGPSHRGLLSRAPCSTPRSAARIPRGRDSVHQTFVQCHSVLSARTEPKRAKPRQTRSRLTAFGAHRRGLSIARRLAPGTRLIVRARDASALLRPTARIKQVRPAGGAGRTERTATLEEVVLGGLYAAYRKYRHLDERHLRVRSSRDKDLSQLT